MRDVFFEYAMSVGTLLRPPPWSRSIRELTTTPDGVNAHAFDPDAAAHIKLVVRNGSVPALRVYASRAECEHDEEGGVAAAEGLFVEDAGVHCAHGEVDIVQVDVNRDARRQPRGDRWTDALGVSRRRDERADARDVHVLRRGGGRAGRHTFDGVPPGARQSGQTRCAESPQAALVAFRRRAGGAENAPRAVGKRTTDWTCYSTFTAMAIATAAAARLISTATLLLVIAAPPRSPGRTRRRHATWCAQMSCAATLTLKMSVRRRRPTSAHGILTIGNAG